MDYKNKYLKYKDKYLALKEKDISMHSEGNKEKYLALKGGKEIDIIVSIQSKYVGEKKTIIKINNELKIIDLKSKIIEVLSIPHKIKLRFGSNILEDERIIDDYNIRNESNILYEPIISIPIPYDYIVYEKLIHTLAARYSGDTQNIVSALSKNILTHPDDPIEIYQQIKLSKIKADKKIINIVLFDAEFFEKSISSRYIPSGNAEEFVENIVASADASKNTGIGIDNSDITLENAQIYGLAKLRRINPPEIKDYNEESDKLIIRQYKKLAGEELRFISRYHIYYDHLLPIVNEKLKDKEVNWYVLKLKVIKQHSIDIITDQFPGIFEVGGFAD